MGRGVGAVEEEVRRVGREVRVVRRARRRECEGGLEADSGWVRLEEEAAALVPTEGVPGAGESTAPVGLAVGWEEGSRSVVEGGAVLDVEDKTNWDSERGLNGDAVVKVEWRSWRED